jgi:NADP-reducing hydrogenase subunit HndC
VVDLARVLMNFFRKESCGKCTPCRVGTERALHILTDLSQGKGEMRGLEELAMISQNLTVLSNCGLGQTSGTPISDILTHFRAEVEAHVRLRVCPTGVCPMHAPEMVRA